jgi:hypothetical protein
MENSTSRRPDGKKVLPLRDLHGLLCGSRLVGYPSGQRGQTVNLLAYAFDGSNPSPTTTLFSLVKSHINQLNIDELEWQVKMFEKYGPDPTKRPKEEIEARDAARKLESQQ